MGIVTEALRGMDVRLLQEGPLPITAQRVVEWLSGPSATNGLHLSPEGAMRISTAYACIKVIAEDVSALPLLTYERLARGKNRAVGHPVYRLLHGVPNPHMTAMQFRETLQAHLCLRGNAYASIERDRNGMIVGLWPLRPDHMDPPQLAMDGRLLYTYHLPSGEVRSLTQDDVLHIRGLSSDGIMGYSPVALHRETLTNALAMQEYGSRFFSNGARPGGVLQTDKRLSKEAAERLSLSWSESHQGLTNAHRIAVLEEGVTYQQVGIAPEDAQYLESRKFSRSETAAIYRVPAHMVNDLERATFSNIEELAIAYVTYTLRSWLVRWEQQINKDLFTPAEQNVYFVEHLVDALLRGKTLERAQALAILRQQGIINADDWREFENMNPQANGQGEIYWRPVNYVPADTPVAPVTVGAGQGQRALAEVRCPECNRLLGRNVETGDFDCPRCKREIAVRDGALTELLPLG